MVADMAQSLVLSLALIAICMITYIGYKSTKNFFNTFFSKLENETPNTKIIKFLTFLSIRFAFFVVLIELFVLFLFVLVFISGGRVNFIVYHQDVWQVFVSPIAIRGMIIAAFPIILGAIGGTFNERAGVINIGIEGIMLMSAFGAVFFSFTSGNPFIGIFGGLLFGFITAFIHAALTITFKSEHVVTGVGINLLALGITNLFTTFIWGGGRSDAVAKLPFLNLSNLSGFYNFPIIGLILQILSRQSILFFIGILLIPLLHILLFKTPFGLRLRVIGEEPSAAATAGIPVKSYQYIAVLISGLIASLGGVFLAIGDSQFFQSNMTGGRGFTALAAMIFGKWTVSGSTGSGLFFGYFYSIAIELKSFAYFTNIYRLLSMMPYIIAILVLAGAIGLARPPKSIGKTYDPQN
jgi:simple sugar transport system permease protein